tara:strand:- start:1194 stop:1967 length:774 start_codon:yes stop_codon:yes gene_type:complete
LADLKKKLNTDKPIIGTWNTLGSSMATKVLASSGLDFQIIDLEHGPFILNALHDHVAASSFFDCSCLVRVPAHDNWMSLQALDQGADGVVFPQVNNSQDAENLIRSTKYFPRGTRGFSPFTFSGKFTNKESKQFAKKSNEENVSVILLEDQEAINVLPEILEIDDLDVIYIGAYDLSKSLGIPGEVYDSKIIDLVTKASKQVNDSNKMIGSFVPQTLDELKMCIDLGLNFITFGVDAFRLRSSYDEAVNFIKGVNSI